MLSGPSFAGTARLNALRRVGALSSRSVSLPPSPNSWRTVAMMDVWSKGYVMPSTGFGVGRILLPGGT